MIRYKHLSRMHVCHSCMGTQVYGCGQDTSWLYKHIDRCVECVFGIKVSTAALYGTAFSPIPHPPPPNLQWGTGLPQHMIDCADPQRVEALEGGVHGDVDPLQAG